MAWTLLTLLTLLRLGGDLKRLRPSTIIDNPRVLSGLRASFEADAGQRLEWYRALSGGAQNITVGGSKVDPGLLAWLRMMFGSHIVTDSFGSSEVGGIAVNGRLAKNVSVRLEAWEDFLPTDRPHPRGELCVKSEELAVGYLGSPAAFLDSDGFFHTGQFSRFVISFN